jgi:branched-chain amino acid transport system permease protein
MTSDQVIAACRRTDSPLSVDLPKPAAAGLYGFAAALLGGIDDPWGTVLGGFLVGVLENIAGTYFVGTELKLTVALVIIVGVLVFKPAGLFGRTLLARV